MLNPVPIKDLDSPIIHHNRDGDPEFPLRAAQDAMDTGIQRDSPCYVIELPQGRVPQRMPRRLRDHELGQTLSSLFVNQSLSHRILPTMARL
jgi:hypothetical protein